MDEKIFLRELREIDALKFGEFILASGAKSKFYLDLRYVVSYPSLFTKISEKLFEIASKNLNYDAIIGIPLAGVPFATSLAILAQKDLHLLRKKAKTHGLSKLIEGPSIKNKKILLVDDLISSGHSKEFAIRAIRDEGGIVDDLLVIVDRRENPEDKTWQESYRIKVNSVFRLNSSQINEFNHLP